MEQNQEQTGHTMAFETIANMLADSKETIDFIAERLDNAQPATISPETEQKLTALIGQLASIKPPTHFTEEQRTWLASALRTTENNIAAAVSRTAVPLLVTEQIKESLARLDAFLADPKITAHRAFCFTIDFKNHRAVTTIIIMGLVILLLGVGNIWQLCDNRQYRDNDLKYRWIKMWGEATSTDIAELQDFFGWKREGKAIRNMRKQVEQYEQRVTEQAEKAEQARLNQQRAEQLDEEAEALKNKK